MLFILYSSTCSSKQLAPSGSHGIIRRSYWDRSWAAGEMKWEIHFLLIEKLASKDSEVSKCIDRLTVYTDITYQPS